MGFYRNKKVGDPKWTAGDEEHDEALNECGMAVDALSRVTGRPTEWLVENVIADQGVTIVAGEPGSGKSFIACQIAADAARELEHRVVLATAGYEPPQLLRWRLDRAEGDARRVALATLEPKNFCDRREKPSDDVIDERMSMLYHLLEAAGDPKSGILPEEGSGGPTGAPGQGSGANRLQAPGNPKSKIQNPKSDETFPPLPDLPRAARLLVIDDIDGWFGKPGNMLSPAALARVVQRLNKLARSLRLAIVVLVRLQLSVEGRITSRQLSRLSHAASVVWTVVKDREKGSGLGVQEEGSGFGVQGSEEEQEAEDEATKAQGQRPKIAPSNPKSKIENPKSYSQSSRRWFLPIKNNLAPDALSVGRSFELVDGRIRWHGDDPAPELAEALLPSVHSTDRRRLRHEAGLWAEEALAAGPLPSKEFYELATDNGYTKPTMQRALSDLGIRPHKTGFNGGWELRWPERQLLAPGTSLRAKAMPFRVVACDRGNCKSQIANCELAIEGERDDAEESQPESHNSPHLSEESQLDGNFAGREGAGERAAEESQLESLTSPCLGEESQVGENFAAVDGVGEPPAEESQLESQKSPGFDEESQVDLAVLPSDDCQPAGNRICPTEQPDSENRKSKIENPKSSSGLYSVIIDALREACLPAAS